MSLPVRGAWIEILNSLYGMCATESLPVRGAWIEIRSSCKSGVSLSRRSPCGERGLKSHSRNCDAYFPGRSPCGERGLKSVLSLVSALVLARRSPCGERGLKSPCRLCLLLPVFPSLPVRGAWIEIGRLMSSAASSAWSLPVRGAWIEIAQSAAINYHHHRRSPCGERGLKSADSVRR